ncbi:MAG: LamG domain-containing protein, partial [Verrucomicrobiota bacterium]
LPPAKAPALAGGSLTLDGWLALGAYPWNWAPIVQQGDDDGYFLGVDSHGYPGFRVKVDGAWQELSVPNKPPYTDANHLDLFKWYHVAGTYDKTAGMMRLYINGKEVSNKSIGSGGVQTANAEVRVGKAGILRTPTEGTHDTLPSDFGIDGLLDEVKVYNVALDGGQLAGTFANSNPGQAIVDAPDMQHRALPVLTCDGKFGATSTRLPYFETWDNLWRFGRHADVVVGFDRLPTKFVFWRGVSYIPMLVNESNQWFTHEFNETGFTASAPGDCEPMSDKACVSSHVRVIENNAARVVVHWRYRLENPDHHWANYDANGWGDLADWHYSIYPDGVACKVMRCYSSKPKTWHEWDEQIVVLGEGQHPENVVCKTPVMTLIDRNGKATSYDWNPEPPKPNYKGQVVQKIHFTGKYHPFAIQAFEGGDIYGGERTWYSVFPSWNHWPTGQANSSGRNASFPDRAAHSSISHFFWPYSAQQDGIISYQEKILMEGMTDQPAAALAHLARSWLDAPPISQLTGGTHSGYVPSRRAYALEWAAAPLRFQIAATAAKPIHNLCLEIRNWPNRTATAALKLNGAAQAAGPDFRQDVNIDNDGTFTLIVWIGLAADTAQEFELMEKP